MSQTKNAFKNTLNLPKTSFPMKANLSQNEPLRLKHWDKIDIYKQLQDQISDRPEFVFHDGPPYANGSIHIGHLLNKVLKDLVFRSQMLLGKKCQYIPGWDCHGLPIEHKVLSELSPEKKEKLASLAPDQHQLAIRNECKKYAEKYIKLQAQQMKRLLTIADYKQPYLTFQPEFEANVLDVFATMIDEGLVFRQLKPVHWSITNQTALAEAELEYMDKTSPSIAVKFKLKSHAFDVVGDVFAVIWTTTPWTIPANLAIAFNPGISYGLVTVGNDTCLIATDRLPFIQKYHPEAKINTSISSDLLIGLVAEHPFINRESPFLSADFVSTEEGSGLVHIAPGHGLDDYLLGKQHGLDVYCPVMADGLYDDSVPAFIKGLSIWDANPIINDKLAKSNRLLFQDSVVHSYPHDWRSKTPVIFRSTDQWFVGVDKPLKSTNQSLRNMALDAIQSDILFVPSAGKTRLHGMLETRPDWCISRQRSWGLPIPAFEDANGVILLTSKTVHHIASLVKEKGSDIWFRSSAQELLEGYNSANDDQAPESFDISSAKKLNDIFDVWFESGSSWNAVLNHRQKTTMSDLYLEGSDQHRGWFHLSLLSSLSVNHRPPYKGLLTHGFIVDKDGRKMSKSTGNAINIDDLLKKYGAEVGRWWVSSLSIENDIKVDLSFFDEAGDLYRKIRNTLRFMISNLFDYQQSLDESLALAETFSGTSVDAYVLTLAKECQDAVLNAYENYQFKEVNQRLYDFCNDTLSSFYCSTIKDRLYCDKPDSERRICAQATLRILLDMLIRLLSPILPHTCDEVMAELSDDVNASVQGQMALTINVQSDDDWGDVMQIRKDVLKRLENAKNEGVNNSLDAAVVLPNSDKIGKFKDDLADVFSVSRVSFSNTDSILVQNLQDQLQCERSWKRDETVKVREDGYILSERDFYAIK